MNEEYMDLGVETCYFLNDDDCGTFWERSLKAWLRPLRGLRQLLRSLGHSLRSLSQPLGGHGQLLRSLEENYGHMDSPCILQDMFSSGPAC